MSRSIRIFIIVYVLSLREEREKIKQVSIEDTKPHPSYHTHSIRILRKLWAKFPMYMCTMIIAWPNKALKYTHSGQKIGPEQD